MSEKLNKFCFFVFFKQVIKLKDNLYGEIREKCIGIINAGEVVEGKRIRKKTVNVEGDEK